MKITVLSSKNRCTLAWSENASGIAEGRFSVSEKGYIQDMGDGKLRFKKHVTVITLIIERLVTVQPTIWWNTLRSARFRHCTCKPKDMHSASSIAPQTYGPPAGGGSFNSAITSDLVGYQLPQHRATVPWGSGEGQKRPKQKTSP